MTVLVDAGALIAILDADDRHHVECVAFFRKNREALVTVWPVVTEAMHVLAHVRGAVDRLWETLEADVVTLTALDQDDMPRMRTLMAKYRDLPMDLADAALVRVAERERVRRVFTVDRRDFGVYRPAGVGRLTIVP